MPIDDNFYPDDGTFLTRFDNTMIRTAGVIGELYQQLTGKSYKQLVEFLNYTSSKGYLLSSLFPVGFPKYWIIKGKHIIYESPLEEEVRMEFEKDNKNDGKYWRMYNSLSSILGVSLIMQYSIGENPISFFGAHALGLSLIVYSISQEVEMFADYLSKAKMNPPPKKLAERIKERVRSLIPSPHQEQPNPI